MFVKTVSLFLFIFALCAKGLLSAQEFELQRGFFFFTNPVYWQAHEDGLAFAARSDSITRLAPESKIENLHFDWDFGFQVGFGYRVPHDLWSVSLELKHIHTNAHGHETASDGDFVLPLWKMPDVHDPSYVAEARAHWRVHLGLLDCLAQKMWHPVKTCVVAPVIGIRTAWIRQKYNLWYFGGSLLPDREEQFSMKNKFWGIGPALGVRTGWEMASHWELFGDFLFSLLYGEFYIHQAEWTLPEKRKILGVHEIFDSSAATADATLGLRWHCMWEGTLKRLSLELAWDQIVLFGQNQFIRFVNPSAKGLFIANQGDLSFQGYHLGARFDF